MNPTSIPRQHLDFVAVGTLIVLCVCWGLNHVAIKATISDVPPLLQASIRSVGATACLLIWMLARRTPLFEKDGSLWPGIITGMLFAFEFLLIYWALEYTYASRSIIYVYTAPFFVAIGAYWFIPGENIGRNQIIGLVVAFSGILVAFADALTFPTYRQLIGDFMIFVAAIGWGATTVLVKASKLAVIAPSKTLIYQLAVSAIILPLASLAFNEPMVKNLSELAIYSLIFQAVIVAFVSYLIWFWLVRHYPAARLSSFTFLTPLFGVVFGGWLLDEPLTTGLLAALVLVGIGIYVVNKPDNAAIRSSITSDAPT